MNQPACPIPGYKFSGFPSWLKVKHAAETNVRLFYRAPLDGAPRPIIVSRVFKNGKIRVNAGEVCFTADSEHLDRFFWLEKVNMSDSFLTGYIECALWSSTDNAYDSGGNPLDSNYDESDLSPECRAEFERECKSFQEANVDDLTAYYATGRDLEHAGHDFWLTRNGHGTGFWDRGLGELGERLSKASKVYGSVDLIVGDDGKIHC